MSKVSVIICFYERVRHLETCLASLAPSAHLIDEVVVSDDGSSPETVARVQALLARQPFAARHVWQEKKGFRVAAARNNGVLHAAGDYLIFFDCDFLLLPGAVEAHLRRRRPGRFVAGFFKRMSEPDTEELFHGGFEADRAESLYDAYSEKTLKRLHFRYRRRSLLMRLGLIGARRQRLVGHVSLFRDDFERVNGYDEQFVGWGGEDEDFGIRLVMSGVHCVSAIRAARALHMWHPPEMGGRHWTEGSNMPYFGRQKIVPRCRQGYAERAALHGTRGERAA